MILLLLSHSLLNFGLFLYRLCKPPRVFFKITPVIYSVRWDQQTRWPMDYRVLHIQIHCLKFPIARPVQVLPELQPAYTHTAARCTRTFSHSCILTNMLKILAPHPDDHIFFLAWLAGLCPGCRIYICPSGRSHLQYNQFVSSPNNGACVWQRWMRAQGSS